MLVVHDDGEALDALTRLFEANGFDVLTAASGFRAQAQLEGARPIDVVVAPWDSARAIGGEIYRWALQRRYDLRDGFVFLAPEPPPELDRLVGGRCLAVPMTRPAELIRVTHATVVRRRALAAAPAADPGAAVDGFELPTLLLADDEPVLLQVMGDLLTEAGYAIVRVASGHDAIRWLEHEDRDAIVLDWNMDDGTGADAYRWIAHAKPHLADRVVFLSDEESDDAAVVAPGRPMFRKGQDSRALTEALRQILRRVRGR